MERKLVLYPNPILEEACEPVKFPLSQEDKELLDDMYKFVKNPANGAVGLAAPQFGVTKRMFVMKAYKGDLLLNLKMVNPRIIKQGNASTSLEGGEECLSEPGINVKVNRAKTILLTGYDAIQGKQIACRLTGTFAIVVQHEIDHLNGVLLHDYKEKEDKSK